MGEVDALDLQVYAVEEEDDVTTLTYQVCEVGYYLQPQANRKQPNRNCILYPILPLMRDIRFQLNKLMYKR